LRFFNGQRKRGENAKAKERKKANKKDGEKQRRSPTPLTTNVQQGFPRYNIFFL